jgi:hypothetical protein
MVDWFSFACCIYEFISGYNPFRSQDALQFGLKAGMVTKENALDYATLKCNHLMIAHFFIRVLKISVEAYLIRIIDIYKLGYLS